MSATDFRRSARARPTLRRDLPAVGKILEALDASELPPPLVVALVRQQLAALRRSKTIPGFKKILAAAKMGIAELARARLQPVINGTGVLVHTNFGRVPLAAEALNALLAAGQNYNNLEFDLPTGARGKRGAYLERGLAELCGAEAACVVNNCAAALVLIVRHFTERKREIVISRGEMVQIGGGFRIGEILQSLGATLREVGATNKTTLKDYAGAIGPETALILKVHRSNFFMEGFVASPSPNELAQLAKRERVPFVEDLGSGAVFATEKFVLGAHEPTPNESLRAGADLVCCSGDKLFGGPQAGIIVGKERFVRALKRHPLFRALRCDKLTLAALQATVELQLRRAYDQIPILRLLKTPVEELKKRAQKIADDLGAKAGCAIEKVESQIGGGALPRARLESVALVLRPTPLAVDELATRLREMKMPIIGYVARRAFKLDLRTIFPEQDAALLEALRHALA